MKIRNIHTGEVVLAKMNLTGDEFELFSADGCPHERLYRKISVREFVDDWQQAEKPVYFYITDEFEVQQASIHHYKTARRKRGGNYFTTEEEAEEMLKEIKNL